MVNSFFKRLRHLIIPHESNNYKARALHNSAVIFYMMLLLLFQSSVNIIRYFRPNVLGYATDITVEKVLELVNKKRAEANLPPLALSTELSSAATAKANDMFSKNYWAHISPTGTTPWAFITAAGYNYVYAGENLARNFNTSAEVVEAWMNSATHRANILKSDYKDIGLAVMNGKLNGEETTLVVQEFGTRAIPQLAQTQPSAIPVSPIAEKNGGLADKKAEDQSTAGVSGASFQKSQAKFLISPAITKTFSLVLAEFLLVVLSIDSLYLWRSKTERLSSHNLAHIIFLAALIGAMGATGIGVIL